MNGLKTNMNGLYSKAIIVATTLSCPTFIFASSAETDIVSTVTSSFTSLKSEALTVFGSIVGIALAIFGFKWVFKQAKSFFTQSAK